jgi:hypothetical protein
VNVGEVAGAVGEDLSCEQTVAAEQGKDSEQVLGAVQQDIGKESLCISVGPADIFVMPPAETGSDLGGRPKPDWPTRRFGFQDLVEQNRIRQVESFLSASVTREADFDVQNQIPEFARRNPREGFFTISSF